MREPAGCHARTAFAHDTFARFRLHFCRGTCLKKSGIVQLSCPPFRWPSRACANPTLGCPFACAVLFQLLGPPGPSGQPQPSAGRLPAQCFMGSFFPLSCPLMVASRANSGLLSCTGPHIHETKCSTGRPYQHIPLDDLVSTQTNINI